jgi:hypothetical protein
MAVEPRLDPAPARVQRAAREQDATEPAARSPRARLLAWALLAIGVGAPISTFIASQIA